MIDPKTLKKHNLKAVPYSCIREGDTFLFAGSIIEWPNDYIELTRIRLNGAICYDNDRDNPLGDFTMFNGETVYVPVWRVTD